VGLNVGELSALLSLDSTPFETGMTGAGGRMSSLVPMAQTAAIGVGAAMAGGAVYSLMKFSDFEAGMDEIFTMLPGMSQDAMDEMTGQVQDFSREFGVLPDQVIPALYQSISAGVPPGNVFDFLETAQKLARAGVTDLETAVDGLTSAMNAYGQENLSASEASDILFTAVTSGKTTVEKMSNALYQVSPIAASAGVGFDQIAAAMATLASKGVPTEGAATQIRQALVELSDAGSAVGQTFQDISGATFRDFIAGGGTMQEALQLLSDEAEDSGISISDMFGSVEAGQGVLGLTGGNADDFAANLAAMGDAAGATDQAYGTMTEGIRFKLDKIKAWFATAVVEIGSKVAEIAGPVLDFVGKLANAFSNGGLQGALDFLSRKFEKLSGPMKLVAVAVAGLTTALVAGGLGLLIVGVASALGALLSPVALVVAGIALLAAGVYYAYTNWEGFRDVVDSVVSWLVDTAWPWIQQFAGQVAEQWEHLVEWTRDHWDAISEAVGHVIEVVRTVIETGLAYIRAVWQAWGDDLLNLATDAWDFIVRLVENAVQAVSGIIDIVLGIINGDWSRAWDGMKTYLSAVWDQIQNLARLAWETMKAILGGALSALATLVSNWLTIIVNFWASLPGRIMNALSGLASLLLNLGISAMRGFYSGMVSMWGSVASFLATIPLRILGAIGSVGSILLGAGRAIINGLWDGMKDAWGSVTSWLSGLNPAAHFNDINPYLGHAEINLLPVGRAIIGGLRSGMEAEWLDVTKMLAGLDPSAHFAGGALSSLSGGVGGAGVTYVDESRYVIVRSIDEALDQVKPANRPQVAAFLEGRI
jgi:TP901 family phage tail tape measure protein